MTNQHSGFYNLEPNIKRVPCFLRWIQSMKTEDIKMFHHIVESGGLVRASELLDLPKSNLSRRLKTLETELGIDLFHRQHKTIVISDNGRRFYQSSKRFVNQFESEIQDNLAKHIRKDSLR